LLANQADFAKPRIFAAEQQLISQSGASGDIVDFCVFMASLDAICLIRFWKVYRYIQMATIGQFDRCLCGAATAAAETCVSKITERCAKPVPARYTCMPVKEIAALPVTDLCLPDCWLILWTTPAHCP
jgi:hypothetical protein